MSTPYNTQAAADFVNNMRVHHIEDILEQSPAFTQLRDQFYAIQEAFLRNERIHVASIDRHDALERRLSSFTDWFPQYYDYQNGRMEDLNQLVLQQSAVAHNSARVLEQAISRMGDLHTEHIAALERNFHHVETLLESHIATTQESETPAREGPAPAPSSERLHHRSSPAPPLSRPAPEPRRNARITRRVREGRNLPPLGPRDPMPYPDIPGGRNLAYIAAARRASRRSHRADLDVQPTTPVRPFSDTGAPYPDIPGGNFLPHFAAASNISRRMNSMPPDVPPTTPVTPFPDAGEPHPDIPGGNAVPHVSASVAQSRIRSGADVNGRMHQAPLTPPTTPRAANGTRATTGAFGLAPAAEAMRQPWARPVEPPYAAARHREAERPHAFYSALPLPDDDQELEWEELATWSASDDRYEVSHSA